MLPVVLLLRVCWQLLADCLQHVQQSAVVMAASRTAQC
jgi:hypothetical protein